MTSQNTVETLSLSAVSPDHKKAPRAKKLTLKVDNLRHIHDHGLAVAFTDPQLVAMVDSLKRDGKATLSAGQSHVTLHTLGHVTFTEAYFSVGNNRLFAVHYFDGAAGLNFSLHKDRGEGSADAYSTLCALILGQEMPSIWKPRSGAQQDNLRTWLGANAWCAAGEAGLRAKAIEKGRATLAQSCRFFAEAAREGTDKVRRLGELDFRALHASERATLVAALEHNDSQQAETAAHAAEVARLQTLPFSDLSPVTLWSIAQNYGAQKNYSYSSWQDTSPPKVEGLRFQGTADSVSPAVLRANYRASYNANGDIVLSSGISCGFSAAALLAGIKGDSAMPDTRYGRVSVVECASQQHTPLKLVLCGCHVVDIAADLGGEFVAALAASHPISAVLGAPAVPFDEANYASFLLRLAEKVKHTADGLAARRAHLITSAAETKHNLTQQEAELPQRIAEAQAGITAAQADQANAEALLGSYDDRTQGARPAHLSGLVAVLVNSLATLRAA